MTEAIFGLIGVIVGGCLTAGVDALQRRAERRRAQRRAARVMWAEISFFGASLDTALGERNMRLVGASGALVESWREHSGALDSLSHDDWLSIQQAVSNGMLYARWDPNEKWSRAAKESLEETIGYFNAAQRTLDRLLE